MASFLDNLGSELAHLLGRQPQGKPVPEAGQKPMPQLDLAPMAQMKLAPRLDANGNPVAPQYNGMGGAPTPEFNAMPDPQAAAPIPSFMGNKYARNPRDPEFLGVDPMIFGYPADNTVVGAPNNAGIVSDINAATGFNPPALTTPQPSRLRGLIDEINAKTGFRF